MIISIISDETLAKLTHPDNISGSGECEAIPHQAPPRRLFASKNRSIKVFVIMKLDTKLADKSTQLLRQNIPTN